MLFDEVNHIAIIVSDLECSLTFYKEMLEFEEFHRIEHPERESTIVYLDGKNTVIELFSFPNPPERPSYPEAAGLRHLAFSVSNFDEILETLSKKEVDYESVRTDKRTGNRMTFIFDPDNLPLEISEV